MSPPEQSQTSQLQWSRAAELTLLESPPPLLPRDNRALLLHCSENCGDCLHLMPCLFHSEFLAPRDNGAIFFHCSKRRLVPDDVPNTAGELIPHLVWWPHVTTGPSYFTAAMAEPPGCAITLGVVVTKTVITSPSATLRRKGSACAPCGRQQVTAARTPMGRQAHQLREKQFTLQWSLCSSQHESVWYGSHLRGQCEETQSMEHYVSAKTMHEWNRC